MSGVNRQTKKDTNTATASDKFEGICKERLTNSWTNEVYTTMWNR